MLFFVVVLMKSILQIVRWMNLVVDRLDQDQKGWMDGLVSKKEYYYFRGERRLLFREKIVFWLETLNGFKI